MVERTYNSQLCIDSKVLLYFLFITVLTDIPDRAVKKIVVSAEGLKAGFIIKNGNFDKKLTPSYLDTC